ASAQHQLVRRIDNRINRQRRNICLYDLDHFTVSSTRFASSYAFLSIVFIVPSTSSNFNVKYYTIIPPPISATTSNPHLCQAYPFKILCRHLPQFLA
ncbi:MAG: hypothetical protein MJZ81_12355, partial [Bacteroidales bacterium]|nr:hypothetical protein [Bacteroidales bacterium]